MCGTKNDTRFTSEIIDNGNAVAIFVFGWNENVLLH